jgi:hypothetical protein
MVDLSRDLLHQFIPGGVPLYPEVGYHRDNDPEYAQPGKIVCKKLDYLITHGTLQSSDADTLGVARLFLSGSKRNTGKYHALSS